MADTALPAFWQRIDHAEQALCLRVNRGCRRPAVRAFFAAVSRAGDGSLWYALVAAVAVFDPGGGWHNALMMAITGAIGAALCAVAAGVLALVLFRTAATRGLAAGDLLRSAG